MASPPSDSSPVTMAAEDLATQLAALQAELVAIKAESTAKVASLEETIGNLAHENALLKRRLYGNKTERSRTSELQLALGEMLAGEAQLQGELDAAVGKAKDAIEPEPKPAPGPRATPKGRRDLSVSKLPSVLVEILDEEREASGCRRIGFEDSRQLMFRRGGFAILVKRVAKYEVIRDGETTVEAVPSPETLFPRALLHTSAIAHVVTSKFALGVPHYRLEQDLADQGVSLDRGTMSRYVEHVGSTLGATIVHAMWQDALANAQVISTDATGALIQPAKTKDGRPQACKKGHFFTAVVDCDAVLFAYAEQHTSAFVQSLFGTFRGCLQADASSVYNILEHGPPKDSEDGVRLLGCFAHLRRYFFEAAICRYPVGLQGLLRIRAIYAADHVVQRAPAAERKALRDTHVRPLVDDFFTWVHAARAVTPGRNLATKALGYAANQEAELRRIFDEADLPLDNTRAERALRKIVVGRKSWMFYGSDTHAEAAAAIFSVIASCRLHGLDPFQYLEEILRLLPYWPRNRYLELAPKYWRATRGRLRPDELASPISAFEVPPPLDETVDLVAAPNA
ncbi:MAG TPA: IS66 family transposase [Kofleriaceae bacterium]